MSRDESMPPSKETFTSEITVKYEEPCNHFPDHDSNRMYCSIIPFKNYRNKQLNTV